MLRRVLLSIGVLLATVIIATKLVEWWTEAWWFEEVGYSPVYLKIFLSRLLTFLAGALFFGAIVGIQTRIAWRVVAEHTMLPRGIIAEVTAIAPEQTRYFERYQQWFWSLGVIFPSLLAGQIAAARWMLWHYFITPVVTGTHDPLYGRDLGFHLLQLPALNFGWSFVFSTILFSLLLSLLIYSLEGLLGVTKSADATPHRTTAHRTTPPAIIRHLALLVALLLLWKAIGYQLSPYNLLTTHNGTFFGAGYTDIHARLPLQRFLCAVSFLMALATLWLRRVKSSTQSRFIWRPVQFYLAATVAMGTGVPWLVQRFVVEPDEAVREQPFLTHRIEWTRRAYGLDERNQWPTGVPQADVNAATAYLPAWSPDALLEALNRGSTNSSFQVHAAHLEEYAIGGKKRAVFVAARELALEHTPDRNWRSTHLLHNFGDGLIIADAQRTGARGEPVLYTNDPAFNLKRRQLFFAEFPNPAQRAPFIPPLHSISSAPGITAPVSGVPQQQLPGQPLPDQTNARIPPASPVAEVWAPPPAFVVANARNALHQYSGQGGVAVENIWRKWLLAWRFMDMRLALSSEVQRSSRVLWHRRIVERCRQLAPFLSFDGTAPYPVVTRAGHVIWILDAFTVSSSYPYAAPIDESSEINYVRNSVKATVDAYDGTIHFYINDMNDPIMSANRAIFPELFSSIEDMPPGLKPCLRYPSALLAAQARIWGRYHNSGGLQSAIPEDVWRPLTFEPHIEHRDFEDSISTMPFLLLPQNVRHGQPAPLAPNLTTMSVLSPSSSQLSMSTSNATETPWIASMLLAVPGQPLREWRPRTPLKLSALEASSPGHSGMQVAPSSMSLALLPFGDRLLYLQVQRTIDTQSTRPPTQTWGILDPQGNHSFKTRADLMNAIETETARKKSGASHKQATLTVETKSVDVNQLRATFRLMQQARRRGDWKTYGEAGNKIERLLERYPS